MTSHNHPYSFTLLALTLTLFCTCSSPTPQFAEVGETADTSAVQAFIDSLDNLPLGEHTTEDFEERLLAISNIVTIEETDLYGIWTNDPNGPHADIRIGENEWYLVDYEGHGNMPYSFDNATDSLTVYYPYETMQGLVIRAHNDTLIIQWKNHGESVMVRWEN